MKASEAKTKSRDIRSSFETKSGFCDSIGNAIIRIECEVSSGRCSSDITFSVGFDYMPIVKKLFKLGYEVRIPRIKPSSNYVSTIHVYWDDKFSIIPVKNRIIDMEKEMEGMSAYN